MAYEIASKVLETENAYIANAEQVSKNVKLAKKAASEGVAALK